MNEKDKEVLAKLEMLHKRLAWISEEEERAAIAQLGGLAARGYFDQERDQIIKRTDELLDQWEAIIEARKNPKSS